MILIEVGIPFLAFIFCWFIGQKIYTKFHVSGTLIIDESNPEKDIWTLELTDYLDDIYKKKSIKLKVERR